MFLKKTVESNCLKTPYPKMFYGMLLITVTWCKGSENVNFYFNCFTFFKCWACNKKNSLACIKAKMNLLLLWQREKAQLMSQNLFEFFKFNLKLSFCRLFLVAKFAVFFNWTHKIYLIAQHSVRFRKLQKSSISLHPIMYCTRVQFLLSTC